MAWITYEKTDGASKLAIDKGEKGSIILTTDEIYTAFLNWQQSDRVAPLSWYIWVTLCEKYPSYDYDGLVTIAYVFADLINSEDIVPRPPSPDHRFQRVLAQVWR